MELEKAVSGIRQAFVNIHYRHSRLILLCGQWADKILPQVAKGLNAPYLNVSLALGEALLEVPMARRPHRAPILLEQLLKNDSEMICLGRIHLLFLPQLKLDPLLFLTNASRVRTLLVAWPGDCSEELLTYAEPVHPEYRQYREWDAQLVEV